MYRNKLQKKTQLHTRCRPTAYKKKHSSIANPESKQHVLPMCIEKIGQLQKKGRVYFLNLFIQYNRP